VKSTKRKHENKTLDEAKTALVDVLKTNIKKKNNYDIETSQTEKEKLKIGLLKISIKKRKINKK